MINENFQESRLKKVSQVILIGYKHYKVKHLWLKAKQNGKLFQLINQSLFNSKKEKYTSINSHCLDHKQLSVK